MSPMRAVLAAVLVLLVAAPATATAGSAKPKLTRAEGQAFVLLGSGFVAGEHVSVTVITGYGSRRARVVARSGRFRVAFRLPAGGCGAAWAARARGDRGSVATVRLGDASPCVPPPQQ